MTAGERLVTATDFTRALRPYEGADWGLVLAWASKVGYRVDPTEREDWESTYAVVVAVGVTADHLVAEWRVAGAPGSRRASAARLSEGDLDERTRLPPRWRMW